MRWAIVCLSIFGIVFGSQAQLVRKRDFDAAFALQAGEEIAGLTSFHHPGIAAKPLVGLKMTLRCLRSGCEGRSLIFFSRTVRGKGYFGLSGLLACRHSVGIRTPGR